MTDYRMFYEKDYLGAWNIPEDGDLVLTIVKCSQGELNQPGTNKKTKKPVVKFKETDKGMALNATNGKTIAGLYGNAVEAWAGKRIALYKSRTRNPSGGDDVDCLRVRPKEPSGVATNAPGMTEEGRKPHIEAMQAAEDAKVLKAAFDKANAAAVAAHDKDAQQAFIETKDARKAELSKLEV